MLREWFRIARLPGIAARLGLTLLLGIVCFWIAVTAVFLVSDNGGGQWFHAFFNEALGVQVFTPTTPTIPTTPTTPTTPAISTTSTLSPILADLLRRIVQFCLGLPYLALSVRAAHRKTIAQRERILIDRTTTCAHCGYPINRTTNPLCPECGTPTSPTSPNTSTTR